MSDEQSVKAELTFEAPLFRVRKGMAAGFSSLEPVQAIAGWKPTALARALALGYRIRKAVEAREVASFSAAARRMKLSPQRVSRLVKLSFLPREIQEGILGVPTLR
ncbi:MAG: hypothetical protein ABSH53_25120 [Holophaga sp.]